MSLITDEYEFINKLLAAGNWRLAYTHAEKEFAPTDDFPTKELGASCQLPVANPHEMDKL
jgi:hypothetical protein